MTHAPARMALNKNLPRHLSELSRLVGREVTREDLMSLEETEAIREQAKRVKLVPFWTFEIPFADKSSPRFRWLMKGLAALNPTPVYVWTPLSNVCGLLRPVALSDVNFGFDFNLSAEGILVILTADLSDKLLLDYSEESDEQKLEIELSGEHWGTARY